MRLLGGEKVMLVVMEAWGCCQMDGVALEEERVRETSLHCELLGDNSVASGFFALEGAITTMETP